MEYRGNSTVNLTGLKMDSEVVLPLNVYQTIAGLLIVSVAVGFPGNVIVAVTILKNKQLHVPIYVLLLQVAILDAVFQSFVVPVNIYSLFHTYWKPSDVLCNMIAYAKYILLCTSGLLLMLVSVYRCAMVCYNNLYMKIKDPKLVGTFCLIAWAETPVIIGALGKKVSFSQEYMTCLMEGNHLQTILSIFIYLPVSCIPIAMYIKISVFVSKARRRVMQRDSNASNKLSYMAASILINHLICGMLPAILLTVTPDDIAARKTLVVIATLLLQLIPAFDFLIFFVSNKTIRSIVINMFKSVRPDTTQGDFELQQAATNTNFIPRIQIHNTVR